MAAPSNHPGRILPQDTEPGDANEEVISAEAVSLAEVEELLYSEDRPIDQRIDRLRELADETRARAAGEIADEDARSLLTEIEGAITVLESRSEIAGEAGFAADDMSGHRETLSPDSDELDEIERADEASLDEADPLKEEGMRRAEQSRRA